MKSAIFYLLISVIVFISISCENSITPNSSSKPEFSSLQKEVLAISQNFGIKLFLKINETERTKNIIISPLSISTALGMVLNGAKNSTYSQIKNTLGLTTFSQHEINLTSKKLIHTLTNMDNLVNLQIANSAWVDNDFKIKQAFIDSTKKYFDAQCSVVDFALPSSFDKINNWVKEKTNSQIKKMVEYKPNNIVLMLLNAIYFKSEWTKEFNSENNLKNVFTTAINTKDTVTYMHKKDTLKYAETNIFRGVELPYGNKMFSMILLLPNNDFSTQQVIEYINSENLNLFFGNFKKDKINLFLPKFNFVYSKSLIELLSSLGITDAFTSKADFTGIGENIMIDKIMHKAAITINESGTEASAVTQISFVRTAVGDKTVNFNKPFIFVIKENTTNTILFIGTVNNPILHK